MWGVQEFDVQPYGIPSLPSAAGGSSGFLQVDPALLKAEETVLQSIGDAVPAEATRLFAPSDAAACR